MWLVRWLLRMLCWQHRGCAQHLSTAATNGLRLRGSLAAQSMCTAAVLINGLFQYIIQFS